MRISTRRDFSRDRDLRALIGCPPQAQLLRVKPPNVSYYQSVLPLHEIARGADERILEALNGDDNDEVVGREGGKVYEEVSRRHLAEFLKL